MDNIQELQAALEAKDAEIAHQAGWIQRLQMALLFWMPGVDLRLDDATRELAADDAMLLAGYSGPLDIERWGDGILERAIAAESRITDLERQLAEETERCARVAAARSEREREFQIAYMKHEKPSQAAESCYGRVVADAIAAAIRGGAK